MLHIVTGCMFAGKTTELANIYNKLVSCQSDVLVIDYDTGSKKTFDQYYLYTHDGVIVPCTNLTVLDTSFTSYDILLINEAQFFTGLKEFVLGELKKKKTVYLFGLDGDFKQEKFGELIDLLPHADTYVKLYAKCACGSKASFSKRLSEDLTQYLPDDKYIPVCRACL
jgi:thymidine kinase